VLPAMESMMALLVYFVLIAGAFFAAMEIILIVQKFILSAPKVSMALDMNNQSFKN
jgi:hypothetical protein